MEESSKPEAYHPVKVAPRLEAAREALGLSRSEFADIVGIDRSSYSKIADGKKPLLPKDAYHIWQLYGIDMNYIYLGQLGGLPSNLSSIIIAHLKTHAE